VTLSLGLRYCFNGIFGLYFSDNDWFLELLLWKKSQDECEIDEDIKGISRRRRQPGSGRDVQSNGRSTTQSITRTEQPRDEGDQ